MRTGATWIGPLDWGRAPARDRRDDSMRPLDQGAPADAPAADLEHCDDSALVAAFLAGRREAFDQVVARHRRGVYHLCFRFTHNHEDAADLSQDVFVRAFKGLARFKGDASLSTWLYRIAVNVCLNRAAVKRLPTTTLEAAAGAGTRAAGALDELLRGERAEAVRRAIEQLPPKQRAALTLRVYQECSHREIASALGTSVGAAKANFFHALGNLRRILGS
jgi:RNA polymerase sigma-70 factor, ECF subfamily